jgi:hypothetical protein
LNGFREREREGNVAKIGEGVVVSMGLSSCKTEVRLVAAYGSPLTNTDGDKLGIVTWVVRRALSSEAEHVWEARAYDGGRNADEMHLVELGGLCYCRSGQFGAMLSVIGLNMAMARPSLMGTQRVFVDQVDCKQLPVPLSELRKTPGFYELQQQ